MGRSSITSNNTMIVFSRTDPEYLVQDNLNAVTTKLSLNAGTEPIITPLTNTGFIT